MRCVRLMKTIFLKTKKQKMVFKGRPSQTQSPLHRLHTNLQTFPVQ